MTFEVYLSLGSNIDPKEHITRTVRLLNEKFAVTGLSSVYRTKPVRMVEGAENFHNLCVRIETNRAPRELKYRLRELEKRIGRDRSETENLHEPRVMDVDIILYDPEPGNFSPHDQIHDEAFVIYPMSELYDPADHPDLPDTTEDWKADCAESVILGTVDYEWDDDLVEKRR